MRFIQNKYVSKVVLCLSIVLMLLFSFTVVNASTGEGGIETYSYDAGTYTFRGRCQLINGYYDGTFMAVEAQANSSDNQSHKVTVSVRIFNKDTVKNYTIYTNGENKKFDYIHLGGIGKGSQVTISCSCDDPNVDVTVTLKTYSW